MNEIPTHDRFIILNGTLCDEGLWSNFVQALLSHMPEQEKYFSKSSFYYVDMTSGASIASTARSVGKMLYCNTRTWVLGYSLGGVVALELARHYHRSLAGLILVCTNADGQTEEKEQAVQRQLAHVRAHGLEAVFDDILLPAYFGNALDKYQREAKAIKRSGMTLGEVVFENQLKKLRTRIDQNANLASMDVPTLLVCGEEDVLCTVQQNKAMHAQFPRSVLRACKNVGHALPLLCAKELAAQVAEFVTAVVAEGGKYNG